MRKLRLREVKSFSQGDIASTDNVLSYWCFEFPEPGKVPDVYFSVCRMNEFCESYVVRTSVITWRQLLCVVFLVCWIWKIWLLKATLRGLQPASLTAYFPFPREKLTFAATRPSSVLIEQLAMCVSKGEPVLLVGETGTGKTSTVQYLAHVTGNS